MAVENYDSRRTIFRDATHKPTHRRRVDIKPRASTLELRDLIHHYERSAKTQKKRNTVRACPGRTKSPPIVDTADAQTMGPGARSVQQRKTNYEPRSSGLKNHGLPSMKARLKSGGSSGRGNHGCVGKVRKSKKQTAGEQC